MLKKIATAIKIATSLTGGHQRKFWRQRLVTSVPRRLELASRYGSELPRLDEQPQVGAVARAAGLQQDGFVLTPGIVPDEWVREMRDYFLTEPCADPYRPELCSFVGPENAPPGTHVAFFDAATVVRSPRALEIANLPSLLQTTAANFGGKPTISYMTAWWSVPACDGTAQHAEMYHRDVDDIDFIKFFLYLTDVDEHCGPHVFVKGSHIQNKLTKIRRYEDAEVHDAFGQENEVRFIGPAGTCFLEKTYGLHRGVPPRSKPRLIFQVLFSMRETIYGPQEPIFDPSTRGLAIDPFINRIYCHTDAPRSFIHRRVDAAG